MTPQDGTPAPEAPPAPAVTTLGLSKRFRGGQLAVDSIDLKVPRGAVYGFLGPNGSGKTTTIRMLLGLIAPTSGSASVLGEPMPQAAARVLPRVGALVEGPAFQPYLTGRANLERLDAVDATADPRTSGERIAAALDRVGLTAAAGKGYRAYSLGMKQRLGLAAALLRPRDLLVLDEPTNGLDPQGTREVRVLVRELAAEGATILVSSHLLAEIEQVCSHIGVMSRGKLLVQGSRERLLSSLPGALELRTRLEHQGAAEQLLARLRCQVSGSQQAGDDVVVRAALGAPPETVTAALVGAGVPVLGIAVRRPTLEDVFVDLTGEGFDVAR